LRPSHGERGWLLRRRRNLSRSFHARRNRRLELRDIEQCPGAGWKERRLHGGAAVARESRTCARALWHALWLRGRNSVRTDWHHLLRLDPSRTIAGRRDSEDVTLRSI